MNNNGSKRTIRRSSYFSLLNKGKSNNNISPLSRYNNNKEILVITDRKI